MIGPPQNGHMDTVKAVLTAEHSQIARAGSQMRKSTLHDEFYSQTEW